MRFLADFNRSLSPARHWHWTKNQSRCTTQQIAPMSAAWPLLQTARVRV